MKPLALSILKLLAAGQFRSGEAMARALGISRASVWQAVREIEATGVDVYHVRGRGYRLAKPLSLIDRAAVERCASTAAGRLRIELADVVASTNSVLIERAQQGAFEPVALAAELQTAGRGRRGRPWHAGIGGALTFSVLWPFARGANELAGLSLAVGVAVARSLERLGAAGLGLKWPNDVLWRGAKVAGVLIELHGDILGPTAAVIGIGVNIRLGDAVARAIDQPAADLETACGAPVDRSATLASLLDELVPVLDAFAGAGFAPFQDEWTARHVYQDRAVSVLLPDARRAHGIARGVNETGALVIEAHGALQRFHSGEVSVRGMAVERVAP